MAAAAGSRNLSFVPAFRTRAEGADPESCQIRAQRVWIPGAPLRGVLQEPRCWRSRSDRRRLYSIRRSRPDLAL